MKLQKVFFLVLGLAFLVSLGSLINSGSNQKAQVIISGGSISNNGNEIATVSLSAPAINTIIYPGQTRDMVCNFNAASPDVVARRLQWSWFQNGGAQGGVFDVYQYGADSNSMQYLSSGDHTRSVQIPNITPGSNFKLQCTVFLTDTSTNTDYNSINVSVPMNFTSAPPAPIYGCIDPTATNYNPNATVSDGSCNYPPPPANDTTVPSRPTNLTTSNVTSHTIKVGWTPSTDNVAVAGYRIYRNYFGSQTTSVNQSTPYMVIEGGSINSYTDVGLVSNRTYKYMIKAVDTSGNVSVWGRVPNSTVTTAAAKTLLVNPPSAVTISDATTSSLKVSWNAPTSGSIYQYAIYANNGGSTTINTTSPISVISADLTNNPNFENGKFFIVHNNLNPNTIYKYRVASLDPANNKSVLTTAVSGTTLTATTPAPATPSISSVTNGSPSDSALNINWTVSSGLGYKVLRSSTQGGSYTQVSSSNLLTVGNFADTGLSENQTYWYKIQACYTATPTNCSAQSSAVSGTTTATPDTTPPTPVPTLTIGAITQNSIALSWTASSDVSTPVKYKIFRNGTQINTNTNLTNADASGLITGTNTINSGLSQGTPYSYTVSACDNVGNCSAQSVSKSGTTLSAPSAPTGVSVGSPTTTSLTVSWNAVTGASSYKVYRLNSAGTMIDGTIPAVTVLAPNLNHTATGLTSGNTYGFLVTAVNAVGESSTTPSGTNNAEGITSSPQITISSVELVRPDTTLLQTLSTSSVNTINIGSQNGGLGSNVTVRVKTNSQDTDTGSVTFNLNGSNLAVENTPPYMMFGDNNPWTNIQTGPYTLVVTPYSGDSAGGQVGVPQTITFNFVNNDDITPPNNPTNVRVVYRSSSQIKINWTNSTSPDVNSYKVYRNGTYVGFVNHPTNTYSDATVDAVSSYSYKVRAVDGSGNEAVEPASNPSANPPIPAPTSSLSTTFAINNQVTAQEGATVLPSPEATSGNTLNSDVNGTVTNGPVWIHSNPNPVQYWYVDFASVTDGWVDQNDLNLFIPITASITAPTAGQVLPVGTSSFTMVVSTNIPATCRWSATSGVAYGSMTETFTGTGTTSHNYPFLGLTNGTSYTRYVSCQSTANPSLISPAQSVTFSVAAAPTGATPVVSTPQRSFTPNQIAVVCNSQSSQSCAVADYYIQQRGIPAQNKVTLNFAVSPQFSSGSMMTKSTFETGFGGTNMRAHVLNQITSAYSSAGLGAPDIQGAMLVWSYPYGVKNNTDSTCYASSQDCLALTTAFAKGQYLSSDANNSSSVMPTNAYFESSSNFLTPRQSSNLIPTFMLPFEYGNYNQGKQYVDNGIVADNTYPTGKVYTRTTYDLRSNTRHQNHISMSALFNQNNISTEHASSAINPNGTNEAYNQGYCSHVAVTAGGGTNGISPTDPGNWLMNKQDVLGYHTGISCPPHLSTLTFRPGALADHVTSVSGALTQNGTSDGTEQAQMNIAKWLNYGVVASAGTIKEPWESNQAYRSKFAKTTELWEEYYTGASAIQSYWSSVEKNGHTNFVGEPLANPWKDPQISFSNNTLTITLTHIKPGETWKLQSSTNGSTWSDVSGQTSLTAPNGKLGLKTITVTNATAPYYRLVNNANTSLPQIVRPVNGTPPAGGGGPLSDLDNPTWTNSTPNLSVGSATVSSLNTTWNTATDATLPVTYKLQRRISGGAFAEVYSGTSTSFSNTGLTAGTTYEFQVRACDGVGIPNCTAWSATASGGTTAAPTDTTAPTIPGTPTSTGTTSSSISLTWAVSTDAVGVTGYKIWRSGTSGGTYTEVGTSATNSYIDGGLPASSTYFYKISAYDAAGNNSNQSGASVGISTGAVQSGGQTVAGINGPVGPNLTTNQTSCTNPSGGTIYYIDSVNGNDSNNGTSTATAWRSIDKINTSMSLINAGKMICFKRGQEHRGRLNLATSGSSASPIIIDAYGTGSAPVISGNILVTNWTQHSGNIWKATVSTPASTPKGLFVGGVYQTNARHPNAGWFFTSSRTANSVLDSGNSWLSGQTANSLTNGEVVMRGSPWSYSIVKISGNSGTTISGSSYDNSGGSISYGTWNAGLEWGYFLRNKLSFLDTAGEWFFDSVTNTVYLWAPGGANPNTLKVEMASFSEGIYIGNNRSDFVIRNLVFEGQTAYGVNIRSGSKRITMENLEIRNADAGIYQYGNASEPAADRNIFRNNYLHDLTTSGIYVAGGADHLIEGNVVERIGVDENRFYTSKMSYIGIIPASTGSGVNTKTVKRNIIRDTGYAGIAAAGGGLITENLVERSMVTLTDGSAITWDGTDGMTISKNIVKDVGVGSSQTFTNSPNMASQPLLWIGYTPRDKGLYFGDSSAGPIRNTLVDDNVVINTTTGIFLDHNNTFYGNKVRNNIVFDFNNAGLGFGDWSNYRSFPNGCAPEANSPCFVGQYDDVVTGNKIYGRASYQNLVYMLHSYSNGTGVVADFGTIDNNYYSNPYRTIKIKQDRNFNLNHQEWTLAQWQANSNEDDNSSAPNYTPTAQPQIFYNATLTPTSQNVGNACRVNGQPTGGTQTFTIQPFSAIVAEYGNC